jgi:hypothetical protein
MINTYSYKYADVEIYNPYEQFELSIEDLNKQDDINWKLFEIPTQEQLKIRYNINKKISVLFIRNS